MTAPDSNPEGENKPRRTPNIPQADVDLMETSKVVSQSWLAAAQITLIYTNSTDFETLVNSFSSVLNLRITTGEQRPEYTKKLELLDKEINKKTEFVKGYIMDKFEEESATSYYSQFGIVKTNRGYKLPMDQEERKIALGNLITALTTYGFQTKTYGLAYWTDVLEKYTDYLTQSIQIDGSVSAKVGSKNELKKQIRKVLNSLIKVITGNYPDDYKNVLRNWGFQKEKY
jgi:hypothetical protein